MTIEAWIKVNDGIVLGADSTTQIWGRGTDQNQTEGVIKTYSTAEKLFRIDELPIAVMSYGMGNIGNQSIKMLLLEFEKIIKKETKEVKGNIDEVFNKFEDFMIKKYEYAFNVSDKPDIGFIMGGISKSQLGCKSFELVLPSKKKEEKKEKDLGLFWRGIHNVWNRLFRGFDTRIPDFLNEKKVDDQIIKEIISKYKLHLLYEVMPLQEAIKIIHLILYVTSAIDDISIGPPMCGPPFDIAVIEPPAKFTWIKKKEFKIEGGP